MKLTNAQIYNPEGCLGIVGELNDLFSTSNKQIQQFDLSCAPAQAALVFLAQQTCFDIYGFPVWTDKPTTVRGASGAIIDLVGLCED